MTKKRGTTTSNIAVIVYREVEAAKTRQLVHEAPTQTLMMLGINLGQHGLVAVAVAAAITGSSLPLTPRMSITPQAHGFQRHYPQTSRLSNSMGSGSPEVSVIVLAKPAAAGIGLNAMPVGGGSSSGGARTWPRELLSDVTGNAHNLFDRMLAAKDEDNRVFMESLIYEGGDSDIPFDPDKTQSQDGRTPFVGGHDGMGYLFSEDMSDPLMEDQLGLGTSFLLDHEFPKDYGLDKEDDEVDINGEPLFDDLPA
ncbi:hypothetical protein D1007_20550 [Hordeum vulgare]|nr:hypothetical protein D1007_20550 [Hordeum vulgare]